VDDYSRFTWTLFLASKDETFEKFVAFIKKVDKRVGHSFVCLRSDHGTEFENSRFIDFYNEHGVEHNFSAPRTPQQNGVVERKNRTLEDMTRTMLIANSLATNFWAEALNTSCYIINRCMIRSILNKTPYKLFKGRKPNIMHLRIFGCKCYVHNNEKDVLGKFDTRSDEVIFLGYSSHSKAHKVFNKKTLCVEKSVHVLFDKSNSLIKNDAQDEDYELGLAKKDLLATHEESKNSQEGSGTGSVSKEGEQGDKKAGGTAAESCLQNKENKSETGSRTDLQKGVGTSSETGARTPPK